MGKPLKYIVFILVGLGILFIGWYLGTMPDFFHKETKVSTSVVLERIKAVSKLTTVEAEFSEIYTHDDYKTYFFISSSKKAIVRVNAKVSAGIDLDKMNISVDSISKTVTIDGLPPAEIFSIDHELQYYDITNGVFNKFYPDDYNKINSDAKKLIEDVAKKSGVLLKAQNQSNTFFETINLMIKGMGYQLIVNDVNIPLAD